MNLRENAENFGRLRPEHLGPARFPDGWPLFTEAEAARFLAGPKGDPAATHAQFKGGFRRRIVRREHPGEGDTTKYGLDDIGVLAAVSAMWRVGIADRFISTAASNALYAWREDQAIPDASPDSLSPVIAAMYGTQRGELWLLQIRLLRLPDGRPLHDAHVHNSDNMPGLLHLPPGTATLANLYIQLSEVLLPLTRALPGDLG